jgi:hypothetical protein
MKRKVTDILDQCGPVAFDQHVDDGVEMWYTIICPWCAADLAQGVSADTYGELYERAYPIVEKHVFGTACRRVSEMKVEAGGGMK